MIKVNNTSISGFYKWLGGYLAAAGAGVGGLGIVGGIRRK